MKLRPVLACLPLAAAAVVTGCGASPATHNSHVGPAPVMRSATIMLDWYPNSDHGGLYTAIRRGYFARNGIVPSAKVPTGSTSAIQLVAAGHAGFGISYETDLLAARAQDIPVRSVMCIMQHPLNTVMALKSSRITRPRQLAGKTVGIAGDPTDIPILSAMLADDGASIRSVHTVNVGSNLLPALLARKVDAAIDVYWTFEAIQAQMKGYPVNVMRVERWGVPNYCELVLVANTATISKRPGYVRSFVRSMQAGYAYAAAHPKYAWMALHTADTSLGRQLVMRSLALLRPVETSGPTVGYQSPAQWRRYASWLYRNKVIAKPVDAGTSYTNRFLTQGVR